MSLVVKWEDVPEASGYELYWSTSKFTIDSLPTDKASIPAGTNEYEMLNVTRQTVYWFVIKTLTSDGGGIFGEVFALGYYPDTGPGPSKLLRGDWNFGFFGEVPMAEIGTAEEIRLQLLLAGVPSPLKPTVTDFVYLKCIVNGKIIFIPSMYFYTNSANASTATYVGMGVCDSTLDDNTAPIVTLNGREYQHRMPRASNSKSTVNTVSLDLASEDVLTSEVGMLAALYLSTAEMDSAKNAENLTAASIYRRFGDYDNLNNVMTLHRSNNYQSNAASFYSYIVASNGGVVNTYWSNGTAKRFLPVLELLF